MQRAEHKPVLFFVLCPLPVGMTSVVGIVWSLFLCECVSTSVWIWFYAMNVMRATNKHYCLFLLIVFRKSGHNLLAKNLFHAVAEVRILLLFSNPGNLISFTPQYEKLLRNYRAKKMHTMILLDTGCIHSTVVCTALALQITSTVALFC